MFDVIACLLCRHVRNGEKLDSWLLYRANCAEPCFTVQMLTQVKNFNIFLFKNLYDSALTLVNERQIRARVDEWPCYPAQVFFIKPGLSESCISYLFDSFTYFLQTFVQKRFIRVSRRSIFKPYTLGNVVRIALLNVSTGTAHTFLTNKIELSYCCTCGVNIIERKTSWARGSAHFLLSLCKRIRGVSDFLRPF